MYADARLKIQRAEKHIADAEAAVVALQKSYVASIEVKKTGGKSIKHECPDLQNRLMEIALVTGDAIHNLRTALDYSWVAVIDRLKLPRTKWTKFPFSDSPDALHKTLCDRKINTANPALFQKLTSEIKPYRGGDHFIWALHEAGIMDKHKLVLPVCDYSGISGIRVQNEDGEIFIGNSPGIQRTQGIFYLDFGSGVEIKDHGEISVSVIFDDGTPLAGMAIPEEFHPLRQTVRNVVTCLENI